MSFWGWSGSAFATAWQEHRDAGLGAFDSRDYPAAVAQFEGALSIANESGAAAQDLGLLFEHLATAYLANNQYQQAQETIALWDSILAENEEQAWAADHRAVRNRLAAFAAKSMGETPDGNGSSPALTLPQPSGDESVPPTTPGTYAIHLGSTKSRESAANIWEDVQERHPTLIEGKRPALPQIDLGDRGVFFRVFAFPFESAASARAACAELQKKDQYCDVMSIEQASRSSP